MLNVCYCLIEFSSVTEKLSELAMHLAVMVM